MKAILLLAIIGVSVVLVYHQFVNGFVDGNNNGKDDVQEYYNTCQEVNGFVDENNNGRDDVQEQEHFEACPKDYYETYPKDYSLSQNRQNLSETSCMSNTIVYWHNGKCYAEDAEGKLKIANGQELNITNGQEVNSTEEASKNAKEILCNKYYELEYCEGQEVNNNTSSTIKQKQEVNNNTSSTIKSKPELDCFSLGDMFDPYYGNTRCQLR